MRRCKPTINLRRGAFWRKTPKKNGAVRQKKAAEKPTNLQSADNAFFSAESLALFFFFVTELNFAPETVSLPAFLAGRTFLKVTFLLNSRFIYSQLRPPPLFFFTFVGDAVKELQKIPDFHRAHFLQRFNLSADQIMIWHKVEKLLFPRACAPREEEKSWIMRTNRWLEKNRQLRPTSTLHCARHTNGKKLLREDFR